MGLYEFTREQRLLTSKDFRKVFDSKTTRSACPELIFIACPTKNQHSRIGFILAKKHIKHAVKRNLIRRIAREHFRQFQHQFEHKDIIVLARKGAGELNRKAINTIIKKMLAKLERRLLEG